MVYTVKKLSEISKVSVRTLHFYDAIDLLKPAYYGSNGYRFYEEEQLLLLQQILFFRELGFELKHIKKILKSGDFDKLIALSSHKQILQKEVLRMQELIITINKTINHLKGVKKMKDQEIYWGFDSKKQKEYEKYLIDRCGDEMKKSIGESNKNTKHWTKEKWKSVKQEYNTFCKELVQLMQNNLKTDSEQVQKLLNKHYLWIMKFWTPTKESYEGLGELYLEPDFKKFYDSYDSNLAKFLSEAMKIFAKKELK